VGGGGAGGDHAQVRAAQAEADRQVPGDHVDDGRGHEERGDPARVVAVEKGFVHLLDGGQPADARAGDHTHAVEIDLAKFDARVVHGVHAGGDAIVHELVHAPGFLGREVFLQLEVFHRTAEAAGKVGDVEAGDRPDAAHPVDDVVPR